jgi:hypothetical protein
MVIEFFNMIMHSSVFEAVMGSLFLILNILDAHSTWLVLRPDNYHRERNPIARWVFKKLMLPMGIVLFKASILGPLSIFIMYWWNEAFTINLALLIGNLLYLYVVIHNYKVQKGYRIVTPQSTESTN